MVIANCLGFVHMGCSDMNRCIQTEVLHRRSGRFLRHVGYPQFPSISSDFNIFHPLLIPFLGIFHALNQLLGIPGQLRVASSQRSPLLHESTGGSNARGNDLNLNGCETDGARGWGSGWNWRDIWYMMIWIQFNLESYMVFKPTNSQWNQNENSQ